MNDSGYLHFGALDGIMQRSCTAAAAAILFGLSAEPVLAAPVSGSESSQQGFIGMLTAHEGIIWIAFYAVLTVFIILLGWEIWVRMQIKQNGGMLPEAPSDGGSDLDEDSENDDSFTSPVLDESEDPFKALLNKASGDESKAAVPKDKKPEAAPKPAPAPEVRPPVNAPAREPFRNNVNINTDTEHIKRRPPAAPAVNLGGFNGNVTVNVAGSPAGGPMPSGQRGAPPPGRVGFTPPKPVQGSMQFAANAGRGEHKPAAPAGAGMPVGGPGFSGAAAANAPARPNAPGGVGLVPPKPPAAPVSANMAPPVNRPNVNAPAPPMRRGPVSPPAVNFSKPGAATGVTPPKHVGLGNNSPGGRPAPGINVGPPKPPAMPFGGGGFNAPKSPGAPQPPAAPNRSSDEDSWKALSGSMASPQPPKAPKMPAPPNAPGGQGNLSLDIKRSPKTLYVE
ncbi:hypothetical protein IJT93_05020 [bacterium]|nr:hypothetical protein [bacterium]